MLRNINYHLKVIPTYFLSSLHENWGGKIRCYNIIRLNLLTTECCTYYIYTDIFIAIFKTQLLPICVFFHILLHCYKTSSPKGFCQILTPELRHCFFFDKLNANCFWHLSALTMNSCCTQCYPETEWHQTVIVRKEQVKPQSFHALVRTTLFDWASWIPCPCFIIVHWFSSC